MQFAKLIVTFILFGVKVQLVENSVKGCVGDIKTTNSIISNNDKTEYNDCNKYNEDNRNTELRHRKRDTLSEILDESSFSGRAILNDNNRGEITVLSKKPDNKVTKHRRKKHRRKSKEPTQVRYVKMKTRPRKKIKMKRLKEGRRKVRFVADVEQLKPLEEIYQPENVYQLKHGYYNGQIAEDMFSNDYMRERKDVASNKPEFYVFRGEYPQPQYIEDLKKDDESLNLAKRDTKQTVNNLSTHVICDPVKQSVVLDSAAPKSIQHIDRSIVEEIIQVDIPFKPECPTTKCPANNESHLLFT